jgi:hypothetical protein
MKRSFSCDFLAMFSVMVIVTAIKTVSSETGLEERSDSRVDALATEHRSVVLGRFDIVENVGGEMQVKLGSKAKIA